MPTQANRQTQNVKVIVNNKACCETSSPEVAGQSTKKRRPRRRPRPEASAEQPQEEIAVPASPMKDFARGLSAYPIRPTLYAPVSQLIEPQYGLNNIPPYFEKQFTNQQATLIEMQKQLEDLQNNATLTLFNNPLFQPTSVGLPPHTDQQPQQQQQPTPIQKDPEELRRDFNLLQRYLVEYQSDDTLQARRNILKTFMNDILRKYNIPNKGTFAKRISIVETMVNSLP